MIMDERGVEIILSLADNNMNETKTARELFMHRNTVIYHLRKVKKLTGLDPMNFYDLCKLVERVRERREGE
jgi:carbohydrate diacid regulator